MMIYDVFSCSRVVLSDLGSVSCCNVLVYLRDVFMFMCLNSFVICPIWGQKCAYS
jgi:hypothetical protein